MATVRSRQAKGRRFQKTICEKIKECFCLDEEEIRTPVGCESGCDIKLSRRARGVVGLSVECKDQKKISVWAAIEQAKSNCANGTVEAVVFKRGDMGSHKTYIIVPFDHYLELRRQLLESE